MLSLKKTQPFLQPKEKQMSETTEILLVANFIHTNKCAATSALSMSVKLSKKWPCICEVRGGGPLRQLCFNNANFLF